MAARSAGAQGADGGRWIRRVQSGRLTETNEKGLLLLRGMLGTVGMCEPARTAARSRMCTLPLSDDTGRRKSSLMDSSAQ